MSIRPPFIKNNHRVGSLNKSPLLITIYTRSNRPIKNFSSAGFNPRNSTSVTGSFSGPANQLISLISAVMTIARIMPAQGIACRSFISSLLNSPIIDLALAALVRRGGLPAFSIFFSIQNQMPTVPRAIRDPEGRGLIYPLNSLRSFLIQKKGSDSPAL